MKLFRVKIESVQLKSVDNDKYLEAANFDERTVIDIVKNHLSKHGLMLPNGYTFTYSWSENTLHVTTQAVLIDDSDAPLIIPQP